MSSEDEENNAKLLSILENNTFLNEIDREKLWEYTKAQIKDGYVKPKRLSGRLNDPDGKLYTIPFGVFNIGHNTIFYKKDERQPEVKIVDGKLVFPEDDEELELNLAVKNDIPYQIYRKILYFGRLTIDELYHMYRGVSKEMFFIIISDMINKRLLKIVNEKDQDVEFNDNAKTIEEFTKVTEKDIQTLEITTVDERRKTLEDKEVIN